MELLHFMEFQSISHPVDNVWLEVAAASASCFDSVNSSDECGTRIKSARSIYISFSSGALKPSTWGGVVYVFLPLDKSKLRLDVSLDSSNYSHNAVS